MTCGGLSTELRDKRFTFDGTRRAANKVAETTEERQEGQQAELGTGKELPTPGNSVTVQTFIPSRSDIPFMSRRLQVPIRV